MNRREARKKLEFEIFRRKLTRKFIDDYDDNARASNIPEPKMPLRREADSTELKRINNYINKVRAIFRAPPSPTSIEIKPRPISVGTQTWPTTTFKPLTSLASTPEDTEMPAQVTTGAKPNIKQPKSVACKADTLNPKQLNAGVKKSAIQARKSSKVLKNRSKWANKTVGFNIVSKSGRYDHATTKRSESPVFYEEPSEPFQ